MIDGNVTYVFLPSSTFDHSILELFLSADASSLE